MMKKRNLFLSLVTSFCLILSAMFILTACGEKAPKYYYFTIDTLPAHVSNVIVLNTNGGYASDSKGKFLVEGDVADVFIYIEEGYTLGSLKVLSNGEELVLSKEDGEYCYRATFEPTKDFAITFSGAIAPKWFYSEFDNGYVCSIDFIVGTHGSPGNVCLTFIANSI